MQEVKFEFYCSYAYIIQHLFLQNNNLTLEFRLSYSTKLRTRISWFVFYGVASIANVATSVCNFYNDLQETKSLPLHKGDLGLFEPFT